MEAGTRRWWIVIMQVAVGRKLHDGGCVGTGTVGVGVGWTHFFGRDTETYFTVTF